MSHRPWIQRRTRVLVTLAALLPSGASAQQHPYQREFPQVGYLGASPADAVARLREGLSSGRVTLRYDAVRGYLPALLESLGASVSSQMLVFSRTSLQAQHIRPESPRAIYFADDVWVAWVPESDVIEIAAVDPALGPVFYLLSQSKEGPPTIARQTDVCLQCHDTYSLGGGGVPRFLLGSGPTDVEGESAAHGSWMLTSDRTPLARRWGGWYVTGAAPGLEHGGNRVVGGAGSEVLAAGAERDLPRTVATALKEPERYLATQSDAVALLVAEHQVTAYNLITRAGWEAAAAGPEESPRLERAIRELGDGLLFHGAAGLPVPVAGASGFAEAFQARGPSDARGRSLRELDLQTRVFRRPLSYLILSEAFATLPQQVRDSVYQRVWTTLGAPAPAVPGGPEALEILRATSPDFVVWEARAHP